jgi:hypothetical protein
MTSVTGVGIGNNIVYSILSGSFVVNTVASNGFTISNSFGTVVALGSGVAVTDLGNGLYTASGPSPMSHITMAT